MLVNVTSFSPLKRKFLANMGAEFAEKVPRCPAAGPASVDVALEDAGQYLAGDIHDTSPSCMSLGRYPLADRFKMLLKLVGGYFALNAGIAQFLALIKK